MLCILLINQNVDITETLVEQIRKVNHEFEIAGITRGVRDSLQWINLYGAPDLIICSPRFADGSCCDIFRQCNLSCPVIFIPVCEKNDQNHIPDGRNTASMTLTKNSPNLTRILTKFQSLKERTRMPDSSLMVSDSECRSKKTRVIIKKGREYCPVQLSDVCLFYFENGLIFLVDKDNRKFMVEDESLNQVYDNLDRSVFYRANRKYIFNVDYLLHYKPAGKNRILVELTISVPEAIIISQYRTSEFRTWIDQL